MPRPEIVETSRVLAFRSCLTLEDRQVVVGHLEDDQGHCRAILVADAIGPEARRRLASDEFVADRRIPGIPVVAPPDPHRLCRVVMPVEIVAVAIAELDL